jgi:hypothetical protein
VPDCVDCGIAGWRCFRGLGSGLDFVGMITDDAFLIGDRRRDCEVEVGVLLKVWADGWGVKDVDKLG